MTRLRLAFAAAFALAALPASAHVGVGDTHGFVHGFAHPIGGPDHVLAMVAVGLFAAVLGGRALWAVPASFVAMMLAGFGLGIAGIVVPAAEWGITASIVALGLAVALGRSWPLAAAMAMVGLFAVFHGYAHGSEMPAEAGALGYAAGFASATALLHAAGVAGGLALGSRRAMLRISGIATAAAGIALALGVLN